MYQLLESCIQLLIGIHSFTQFTYYTRLYESVVFRVQHIGRNMQPSVFLVRNMNSHSCHVVRNSFQTLPMMQGFSCNNENIRSVQMTIVRHMLCTLIIVCRHRYQYIWGTAHNQSIFSVYGLGCNRRRFYSTWNRCYGRLHSRSACFGQLYKKHIIVTYSSSKVPFSVILILILMHGVELNILSLCFEIITIWNYPRFSIWFTK